MGILIILISVGIMVGRWAIRRANKLDHMNAARKLETALLAFKNENKFVPKVGNCSPINDPVCYESELFSEILGFKTTPDYLSEYLEEKPFNGGTDATYYYTSDSQGQFFIVCVSLGGEDDENNWGFYCTGTGIGFLPEENPITKEEIEPEDTQQSAIILGSSFDDSDWCKEPQEFRGDCN
jgi:hypothetical protein